MKTYYMGRFAIDVPTEFKLVVRSQQIRYAEISDFKWHDSRNHVEERNEIWAKKITEISKLHIPIDKKQVIIKESNLNGIGLWAKEVEYYGNNLVPEDLYSTVIVDYGDVGVILTLDGEDNSMTEMNFRNILSNYKEGQDQVSKESFCLSYGKILLPYLEQEKTYARFEGPMDSVLRIEMEETHKVEPAGVMDRLAASLAVNFAPGVAVDKIRTNRRTIDGLGGQEIVTRLSDNNSKELFFAWDYQGKENSGEFPEIKIAIESPDGNIDAKLTTWEKVLYSFRHAYK